MSQGIYLGVDVGTGSVRAGLFDGTGRRLGLASEPIRIWRPRPDFVEQSSDDIWAAAGRAVRAALKEAGAPPSAASFFTMVGTDSFWNTRQAEVRDRFQNFGTISSP